MLKSATMISLLLRHPFPISVTSSTFLGRQPFCHMVCYAYATKTKRLTSPRHRPSKSFASFSSLIEVAYCKANMLPRPQAPCCPTSLLLHRRPRRIQQCSCSNLVTVPLFYDASFQELSGELHMLLEHWVRPCLDAGKIAYVGLWGLYASGVLIPEVVIRSPHLDQRSPLYMNVEPQWRMQRTTSVR